MSPLVREAIDAGLAELTPVTSAPSSTTALGYGADISCSNDIDPTMALVDSNSALGIAQSTARRWDCPRGALPPDAGKDSTDYGFDLRSYCNRGTTQADMRALEGKLRSEATKDDRIATIKVEVTPSYAGAITTLDVRATIFPVDPTLSPIGLVLRATSAEVLVVAIGAAT